MTKIRKLVASTALALALLPSSALAVSRLVQTNGRQVVNLGGYRTTYSAGHTPTLGDAVTVFGSPSSRIEGRYACYVRWPRLGLRIDFVNYSVDARLPRCRDDVGLPQQAHMTGRGLWRTSKGLVIGDTLTRLRSLYPRATGHGASWWLISIYSTVGTPGRGPVLSAYVKGGRVASFRGAVGAAGE